MAKNVVKIGGEQKENLVIEYKGETYEIPFAKSMKRKELKLLKDEDAVEAMFAKYIPTEVLDEMTPDEYEQLANAWIAESQNTAGADLGES